MKPGVVCFVGAGPGDPELLTIKGLKALQRADVVVFDRLVHPALLLEADPEAKFIYCGKKPCEHTLRQQDIQTELLIQAKKGKRVVRLKGGDPGIFGRVGEEAEMLRSHKVAYEMIPGVTAASAASLYAGVPLTHRDHARSLAIVTGHSKEKSGKPEADWAGLAKGMETIVFYMGMKNLPFIASELISHGKNEGTPVLVVEWGTCGRQREIIGTLADIERKAADQKMANPSIIIVGEVAVLHHKLQWIEKGPLTGEGCIIHHATPETEKFQKEWESLGAEVYTGSRKWGNREKTAFSHLTMVGHASHIIVPDLASAADCLESLPGDLIEDKLTFYCCSRSAADSLKQAGAQYVTCLPEAGSFEKWISLSADKPALAEII
ncbi:MULTISPECIES: uroporphyrinogen-III C-methyltransferase [Sinobaca]|uniref:Uroporphyrinogen-III C-methyltransferase n=1 Tax=Sinobaca qinghaiensis TaxID=342944 RepID=A0A419V4B1_9BACL|nr:MULTISPECIES: uroporphyrinogen-III C-methyltransferase [Sinobaca]RKD73271.1 uroporphyrinogen III methyltransferase/synthase [Sinobaca qinghaiensis]